MKEDFLESISKKISGKKIILIGEIHGTKEIPRVLTRFFSEHIKKNDFNICLELPSNEQEKINNYFSTGDENLIREIFYNSDESDGRKSLEYMELIKKIYEINKKHNKKIKIIFIDIDNNFKAKDFQNEREKIMAKNILKSAEKQTFAILGNIHASKKIIDIAGVKIIPTGYYIFKELKRDFVNINLIPKTGRVHNLSIKKITSKTFQEYEKNYDYVYYLESVSPAKILKKAD